jgi:hypothetical protein
MSDPPFHDTPPGGSTGSNASPSMSYYTPAQASSIGAAPEAPEPNASSGGADEELLRRSLTRFLGQDEETMPDAPDVDPALSVSQDQNTGGLEQAQHVSVSFNLPVGVVILTIPSKTSAKMSLLLLRKPNPVVSSPRKVFARRVFNSSLRHQVLRPVQLVSIRMKRIRSTGLSIYTSQRRLTQTMPHPAPSPINTSSSDCSICKNNTKTASPPVALVPAINPISHEHPRPQVARLRGVL